MFGINEINVITDLMENYVSFRSVIILRRVWQLKIVNDISTIGGSDIEG